MEIGGDVTVGDGTTTADVDAVVVGGRLDDVGGTVTTTVDGGPAGRGDEPSLARTTTAAASAILGRIAVPEEVE